MSFLEIVMKAKHFHLEFLCFSYIIKNTLSRLSLHAATINIPVNISSIEIHKINQPPWIVW